MRPRFIIGIFLVVTVFFASHLTVLAEGEATALPGLRGDLAYATSSSLWLVVTEGNGIHGQMMNQQNKPVGSKLTIHSGDGLAPKVAYDPLLKRFLVIWKNGSGTAVYGRFISDKGVLADDDFKLMDASPDFERGRNSTMKFDQKNKRFVAAWGEFGPARLVTITQEGTLDKNLPIRAENAAGIIAPEFAINSDKNEYCLSYQATTETGDHIALIPINAATGDLGTESYIAEGPFASQGIGYSPQSNTYLVLYGTPSDNQIQILPSCAADENSEAYPFTKEIGNWAMMSYNPTSDTYGIATQSQTAINKFYIIDSSGNVVGEPEYIFFNRDDGTTSAGNFNPMIQPNISDGTYAAISSEKRTTTKFISRIGWPEVTAARPNAGAIETVPAYTPPDEGLPKDLGQFIGAIFKWSLTILGLIVFIQFLRAGLLWFTARGNTANTSKATEMMWSAVQGAAILVAAYVILYSINPDLVKGSLNLPGLPNANDTNLFGG